MDSPIFFNTFAFLVIIVIVHFFHEGEGIIGGDDAKEGEYPYQVFLQVSGAGICGGSIIDDCYILTAAHCLINTQNKLARTSYSLKVIAGTSSLRFSSPHKVIATVQDAFVPAEYDRTITIRREVGDIAVLKLKQCLNMTTNPKLQKLNLPNDQSQSYDSVTAVVTGFGWNEVDMKLDPKTSFEIVNSGHSYGRMRYAKANVMSNENCDELMVDVGSKHLCASLVQRNTNEHEGVCRTDSGGPLVYDDTVIGVVSKTPIGCTEHKKPSVYTRVSSYVNFIKKVMNGNIDSDVRHFKLSK